MLVFDLEPTFGDDDDDDEASVTHCQSFALSEQAVPNPLHNPTEYCQLVIRIYQSSSTMMIGNMLEWLDFGIYGYSEQEISQALFANNKTAGWAAFGLGYAFRPIGAYVLGHLADSSSRRYAFQLAVIGMAVSTATMAFLPSVCGSTSADGQSSPSHLDRDRYRYCVTNVYSSAIPAVLLRCCQGFSAGAAAGGVNVIQSEASKSAQSVGVNNISGAAASIVSALLVYGLRATMGQLNYATWGWRLAFALVIPPSIFAASGLRSKSHSNSSQACGKNDEEMLSLSSQGLVAEGAEYSSTTMPVLHSILPINSIAGILIQNQPIPRHTTDVHLWLLITLSIFVQFAISAYNNLNIYMVQYSREKYQISSEEATLMALVGKVLQLLLTPFAAGVADIYGCFTVCGISGAVCTVLAVPVMAANRSLSLVWFLVAGLLPCVSTFWILNAPLLVTSLFPKHHRSQGTSLVMAMGTGIAGFFPLVLHQITVSNLGIDAKQVHAEYRCGVVLMIVAGLASGAIFWIRREARKGHVVIYQRPDLI